MRPRGPVQQKGLSYAWEQSRLEVSAYDWSDSEREEVRQQRRLSVVGSPATVRARIEAMVGAALGEKINGLAELRVEKKGEPRIEEIFSLVNQVMRDSG